ncbi:hypothetical protein NADFUDRAFT_49823 [Nadsonia fulvescens var. elongata DSM 6958]|uniref:Uncharacterized protein n=1 Tax=Nadsonia fulvescens var. elongata DSM 6958 TaxID=857566 RepID=A0A1E3PPP5_9ASCO|nr:hypothetical protein NADFUDRAFT_49823 [Nadsonia fulvescens var. elongata DSM 6958]
MSSNIDLEKACGSADNISNANVSTSAPNIKRIHTSGPQDQYIHVGDSTYRREEFLAAFGGTLNPGYSAAPSRKFANPAPLGLSAFALTTFVLSLINMQARDVTKPNIVVGLALFYGGLVQLLAGMWEIVVENTFGGTALSSYGGFWLSWGCIQVDAFGIVAAYGDDKKALSSAIGFYLIGWFIFTFMLTLCTVRATVAFFSLFFTLTLTFLLLACGEFTGKVGLTKAGGAVGIICAFISFYNAFAGIATKDNSYFIIKPLFMPGARVPRD